MTRTLGGLAALLLATPVLAQDVCDHGPLIVKMADYVLETRTELPPLRQARYGDTAAFLLIQYGDEAAADVLGRVANSSGRAPRLFDDLTWAYALSQPSGLAAWDAEDPKVWQRFVSMQPSTRRALILADEGETYLQLVAAVRAAPALESQFATSDLLGAAVAFAIADQPETVRVRVAERAEMAGELRMAAALLGDLSDRALFDAFLERNSGDAAFMAFEPEVNLGFATIGALNGASPLRGPRLEGAAATLRDLQFFAVQKAALTGMPSDYLSVYLNQSGKVDETALAAQAYLDALAQGAFDPVVDPEAAWLALYEAMLETDDAPAVQQVLGSYNWPSQSIRSYAGFAVESLDVMVAKDAFGPYVRRETDMLPDRPESFAGTLDWDRWAEVAVALPSMDVEAVTADTLPIALELLWEAGAYGAAVTLAIEAHELSSPLPFLRDAMVRLDAQCEPRIGVPGAAIRYGGQAVYRFY